MINSLKPLPRRAIDALAKKMRSFSLVSTPATTLSARFSTEASSTMVARRVAATGPGIRAPWGVLGGVRSHIGIHLRRNRGLQKIKTATSSISTRRGGSTLSNASNNLRTVPAMVRRGSSVLLALFAIPTSRRDTSAKCDEDSGEEDKQNEEGGDKNEDNDDESYAPPKKATKKNYSILSDWFRQSKG